MKRPWNWFQAAACVGCSVVLGIMVLSRVSVSAHEVKTAPKPNNLLVLTDDQGWPTLGAKHYGFDFAPPVLSKDEFAPGADRGVETLTDQALEFIEQNRDQPWFCFLSHHMIHGTVVAPEEITQKYRKQGFGEEGPNRAVYLAGLEWFDHSIGRLMSRLDELGESNDTLVLFLSDNGGINERLDFKNLPNPHPPAPRFQADTREYDNAPLRSGKGSSYEGDQHWQPPKAFLETRRKPDWLKEVTWSGREQARSDHLQVPGDRRRPRLIVLTDIGGDPDDQQSLIRLLVTSNEFRIEGIVASALHENHASKKGPLRPELIREIIAAYAIVQPNLAKHAKGFPAADDLLRVTKIGSPTRGIESIGEDMDTQGSRWITSVVDRGDSQPVNIAIWGGSTDLAQALWRVRNDRDPEEVEKFISRIRVHAIGHQCETGPWILQQFPSLWYTLSLSQDGDKHISAYRGMWKHGDRSLRTRRWLVEHVQTLHGPLGALYPLKTWSPPEDAMKEGDTPSWFAFLPNGLTIPSRPDYGGWGGRFRRGDHGPFRDAQDTIGDETSRMATVWRWRQAFQNEFAARLDWCVRSFEQANHSPIVALNNTPGRDRILVEVQPGAVVTLDAAAKDPDHDRVGYRWYQYVEPGTHPHAVSLMGADKARCSFTAPRTDGVETLHLILEVTDNGSPPLTAYRRAIIRIVPE